MRPEELFEAGSPLARAVAAAGGDPIGAARAALAGMSEADRIATLDAHPRIGARAGLSELSRAEQGSDADPAVLAELERLNALYERRFGFRFVVFVNGRSRSAIAQVLRDRLENTRERELETGLEAIVAIAEDRLRGR